ncbi:Copia protein [Cyphomyrmex costatus]|uniref:Copia protein n=1 Tax=Cyphomyrmex costatus TaxID=456900 RepID=A0A151K2I9_9HYME|nr:Copia protein [Cyphomyrmex costatus]
MHNLPFQNNRSKANDILEIIHTDVCGSFKTAGPNGERYFVSFIDDYSIFINTCPVYVHELNGTAERFNRTIMDMARCLLDEAQVHKKYWPEIISAATYLKNRSLANTIEKKTPYEIFFRKRPNVSHLKLYESKVFVRKPEQKRLSKWDKKADMGILLGYSDVGYRVLVNNRIIVMRHVDIVEKNIKCINLDEDEPAYLFPSTSTLELSRGEDSDHENNLNDSVFESTDEDDEVKIDKENVSSKIPRRST